MIPQRILVDFTEIQPCFLAEARQMTQTEYDLEVILNLIVSYVEDAEHVECGLDNLTERILEDHGAIGCTKDGEHLATGIMILGHYLVEIFKLARAYDEEGTLGQLYFEKWHTPQTAVFRLRRRT